MTAPYAELRCHTAFSFGDGTASPEAVVARAAEMGYAALGLTDHADLGGVIRFALEAEKQGVRALIGAEIPVDGYPTALLARDEEGYRNLAGLITRARVGALPGAAGGRELTKWGSGGAGEWGQPAAERIRHSSDFKEMSCSPEAEDARRPVSPRHRVPASPFLRDSAGARENARAGHER